MCAVDVNKYITSSEVPMSGTKKSYLIANIAKKKRTFFYQEGTPLVAKEGATIGPRVVMVEGKGCLCVVNPP